MIEKNMGRLVSSGVLAGIISTLVFTVVHDIFISDIWSMLVIMLVAGMLCGLCISLSFALLVERPSPRSWLLYNMILNGMLILLGVVSLLLFEPTTTMAALVASNGLPLDLLGQATPMAAVFTLVMAVLITIGYGRNWRRFGAVFLTSALLVLLLGHNVFILGLVAIPCGSLYLVLEMFGLILLLNVVYVVAFMVLAYKQLWGRGGVRLELR